MAGDRKPMSPRTTGVLLAILLLLVISALVQAIVGTSPPIEEVCDQRWGTSAARYTMTYDQYMAECHAIEQAKRDLLER
jgi:hypothetical protein